jgi:hypothetical protein
MVERPTRGSRKHVEHQERSVLIGSSGGQVGLACLSPRHARAMTHASTNKRPPHSAVCPGPFRASRPPNLLTRRRIREVPIPSAPLINLRRHLGNGTSNTVTSPTAQPSNTSRLHHNKDNTPTTPRQRLDRSTTQFPSAASCPSPSPAGNLEFSISDRDSTPLDCCQTQRCGGRMRVDAVLRAGNCMLGNSRTAQ